MPATEIARLHQERMFRLRQLQKELTLQNRAFVAWTLRPTDAHRIEKWCIQRNLVEQAEARFHQAQGAYLAAVIGKNPSLG